MKAKKFIEKYMDGDTEIIKNHVIEIDVNRHTVEYVAGGYLEASDFDPEEAFNDYGVLMDEDGEPVYIKIEKFLDAIDKKADDIQEELEPDDYAEIQKLKEYRDYELWVKS